jgi:hypothetical protein
VSQRWVRPDRILEHALEPLQPQLSGNKQRFRVLHCLGMDPRHRLDEQIDVAID